MFAKYETDSDSLGNLIVGSRVTATSKMERFVIIFNGQKSLTIITKRSFLDVAVALDPSLNLIAHLRILFIISDLRFSCNSFKFSSRFQIRSCKR